MTNITINESATWTPPVLLNPDTPYLAEEVCKPYIQTMKDYYIGVALFNFSYSFLRPVFIKLNNKYKDRFWIKFDFEGWKIKLHPFDTPLIIADGIFFVLNFFVFGYWLATNNLDIAIKISQLPVIRWFI